MQAVAKSRASREIAGTQRDWYRLLEAEGFDMSDMLRRHDGSFLDDGTQYGRRARHVSLECVESEADGETDDVWSLADAVYWRRVSHAASALPANYPGRSLLVAWADLGDVLNAARACSVSRWYARKTVDRFLARMELKCV